MKRLLYSVCLFVITLACGSDIFPTDLLYQRWQLERTRQGAGAWVSDTSTVLSDTEYKRDGTVVYRKSGQVNVSCGRANRFTRQQIDITFFVDISCEYVFRTEPLSYKATITQLTGDLLELTTGETVSQYRSVK